MARSSSTRKRSPRAAQGERKKTHALVVFFVRLVREKPLGALGAVITLLLLLTGIFAGVLAPYGMNEQFGIDRLSEPSARFWLGTDNLGRDILSRIIYGARVSVIVGLAISTLCAAISTFIGIVCGYIGGKLDFVVQRIVDAVMTFPSIVVLMVVISIVGPSMWAVIIVTGTLWGITHSRIIRGAVIGIRENAYVEVASVIGCSRTRILIKHILPNIMAPVIILFTTRVPSAILTEASLSFLGFGVPPPTPSWGGMLSGSGRSFMFMAPWMVIWPGLALATVVYGVNMFGDAMRDLLDPRLRGTSKRHTAKLMKRASKESDVPYHDASAAESAADSESVKIDSSSI